MMSEESGLNEVQERIIEILVEAGGPVHRDALLEMTGLSLEVVRGNVGALSRRGLVEVVEPLVYRLPVPNRGWPGANIQVKQPSERAVVSLVYPGGNETPLPLEGNWEIEFCPTRPEAGMAYEGVEAVRIQPVNADNAPTGESFTYPAQGCVIVFRQS
jgi:hypothetical protein